MESRLHLITVWHLSQQPQNQSEIVSSSGQSLEPPEVVTIPKLVCAINDVAQEENKETCELKHWILRHPVYAGFLKNEHQHICKQLDRERKENNIQGIFRWQK